MLTKQHLTSSTETITTIIDRELRQMLITSTGQMMMEEAGGDTSGDGGVTSSLLRASKYAFK